ncbi:histidine triad nucleotide-binding protein [Pleionea mediterranea]|uniref:Histidine triad (HIT) family protein n=1 Tax=Pleionea mediterranea TaxID=523701 RepID=A0A316FJX1_9GAMM|nr:histidine triad nucleotide-binding protein [Pleionea mediterranea]PWK48583.1 histidine triad (HIT) family protein [Pleionea mediterranea]
MNDCLFCKIIDGDIPSKKVYEDDLLFAFHDISPKAPTHVLLIPKKHIDSLNQAQEDDKDLMAHALLTIPKVAKQLGLDEGYRTILNTEKGGGQEVFHIHFHILGGGSMPFA